MLKNFRLGIACHTQAAISSFRQLCRRPLASMMTIMVIAIALTLPALFWVFSDNMSKLTIDWQQGGHISLYLKSSLTVEEQDHALQQARAMSGVGQALLKTAEEGLKELQQQEGMHDILQYLPENPLPAVIEITPSLTVNTPAHMDKIYQSLKTIPGVAEAKIDMRWITRLDAILSFMARTAHGLMLLLASAVILIVGNALRLAIQARHEEIRVLKLIGATDSYIVRPFLYSGIWYGLGGAIFAVLFVNIFMFSVAVAVRELAQLYQMNYPLAGLSIKQAWFVMLAAVLLGWMGARLSVKRQLAVIEPYQ